MFNPSLVKKTDNAHSEYWHPARVAAGRLFKLPNIFVYAKYHLAMGIKHQLVDLAYPYRQHRNDEFRILAFHLICPSQTASP